MTVPRFRGGAHGRRSVGGPRRLQLAAPTAPAAPRFRPHLAGITGGVALRTVAIAAAFLCS